MTQRSLFDPPAPLDAPAPAPVPSTDDLPPGWRWTTLGEVARINPRDAAIRALPDNLDVTFVPMAAVDAKSGTIAEPEQRPLAAVRKGFTPFADADVLFAKITPCMENGKAAIAANLTNGIGFGSTEFHVLRPEPVVIPAWLFYFVRQSQFRAVAKIHFSGAVGQQRVPTSFLEDAPIPLAPLPEQGRIVAAIEEQFTRLDAGVAALQSARAKLKRYRASVLKAACAGRLVPQDASDEPAAALLARIAAARRAKCEADARARGKDPARLPYPEPAPPNTAALPELPPGWVWATVEELIYELKNGLFSGSPYDEPIGLPILRISAVRPLALDISTPRYIPADTPKVAGYLLADGDLLFTRYNGSLELVGACAMVRGMTQSMVYPDKLIRVRLYEGILPTYLEAYFATQIPRGIIERKAKSTAGQQGIAGADLKAIPVALPPLAAQARIVAEVERRLSVIAAAEASIAASLRRAERLRQAVLARAFAGRLVPHDPTDEPASVLLERIHSERETPKPSRTPRARRTP